MTTKTHDPTGYETEAQQCDWPSCNTMQLIEQGTAGHSHSTVSYVRFVCLISLFYYFSHVPRIQYIMTRLCTKYHHPFPISKSAHTIMI